MILRATLKRQADRQALSFDVSGLSPLLLLSGVAMFRVESLPHAVSAASLSGWLDADGAIPALEIITPYEDVPSLRILMGAIATDA